MIVDAQCPPNGRHYYDFEESIVKRIRAYYFFGQIRETAKLSLSNKTIS